MKYHIEFDVDFKRNPYKGIYIALEGVDGSGKTTQVKKITDYFIKQGREVIQTREPRKENGLVGELVQEILLGKTTVSPLAFQYLFTADRVVHQEQLILPALKGGKVVISDRSLWSAIPYGILDREDIVASNAGTYILMAQSILSHYHQFIIPNYTFYLNLPLETANKRLQHSGETKEIYDKKAKLKKIVLGYKWLLQEFPKEFIVINSQKPIDEVTLDILKKINK